MLTFTSIETTLELNQLLRVANVLVSKTISLSTYWHMWPLIKLWKTITKFLYGGYISIFGALVRLLSDRGTSFTSSIIEDCARSLASNDCGLHPTTPRLMAGREISSDNYVHDWEVGRRQESWLAITLGWNSACLQCHPIHSYWLQSTLFDVWMTAWGSQSTLSSPPLAAMRSPWERPPPGVWMCM